MASTHVFPQTGDNDDAENFAQLIGQSNLSDFVETGMTLSADYTNLSVSISDGLAYIAVGSQSASSTSETRLSTTMVVQMASATKSLTDADVNHVYIEPNIGTDDSATFAVYTNTSNAATNALKIGEVDTSNNTTTESNRNPDVSVEGITAQGAQLHRIVNDGSTKCHVIAENRFGSEGSSTTSTSYTTIAASDLMFNPDEYKDENGNLYVRIIAHLKHSTDSGTAYARMYRQNAATAVTGSAVSVTVNNGWGDATSGWVDLSTDSGFESYHIQLKSGDGNSVRYNSIIIQFGVPA